VVPLVKELPDAESTKTLPNMVNDLDVESYVNPDSAIAPSVVPSEVSILVNAGFCTVENPVPLVPEEPLVPELPLVPEEPELPDVPELPEEPLVPELPLVPDEPDIPLEPEEPLVPDEPDVPELPLVPEEPLVPLEPEEPSWPSWPGSPDGATCQELYTPEPTVSSVIYVKELVVDDTILPMI